MATKKELEQEYIDRCMECLSDDQGAMQAICIIYSYQTSDEQLEHATAYENGIGFNALDAKFGSRLAERILAGGAMSVKQVAACKRLARKYHGQIRDWVGDGAPISPKVRDTEIYDPEKRKGPKVDLSKGFPLTKVGDRWELAVDYNHKDLAKEYGFRWDPAAKVWYTDTRSTAYMASLDELVNCLDEELTEASLHNSPFGLSTDTVFPAPEGKIYRSYQEDGMVRMIGRTNTLLGDEMGLGKTIQVIGALNAVREVREDPHFLIVCPTNLSLNWERELEWWGIWSDSVSKEHRVGIADQRFPSECETIICPYSRVVEHTDELASRNWDFIAIDEAHYLKNRHAQRTIALLGEKGDPKDPTKPWEAEWEGGVRGDCRVAMTGTPLPNRPIEVWNMLHWLDPDEWKFRSNFAKRYCEGHEGAYGWDESGASNLDELNNRLKPIMLRRLKSDVLVELPPKERQVIALPRNSSPEILEAIREEDEALAEMLRQRNGREIDYTDLEGEAVLFKNMSKVRHRTAQAKVPAVVDHVLDVLASTDKVVVFAHHRDVLAKIKEDLAEFNPVMLRGGDNASDKQDAIDTFQNDPACRVFVGSLLAAGVGVTLTAAQTVVFAELDWVPGNVSQAEDRCHRMGQTCNVLVRHLVVDKSIDANIAYAMVEKQRVIDQSLGEETKQVAGFAR